MATKKTGKGMTLILATMFVCLLAFDIKAQEDSGSWQPLWQPLFNGHDLAGWDGVGGQASDNWEVDDGVLRCTGGSGAGWLATTGQISDFELELEYNLPANGNSGVFFRAPKTDNPWVTGMEIQLLDDQGDKAGDLQPAQFTGAIYQVVAPSGRATKQAGQWQSLRVLCKGNRCQVWVNGEQVVDADLDQLASPFQDKVPGLTRTTGHIGLQNHGDRVSFRNIRLRDYSGSIWKFGIARANITPEQPMWMSGYASRNRPADGKLSDLFAKALVLEDVEGHRGVLITLDLIGIDRRLAQAICDQLGKQYGLRRDQIALCTSHTHTGPALQRNLAPMHYRLMDKHQQQLIEAYTAQLESTVVKIVGEAMDSMQPSQLSWGDGHASFATNRRENPASEVRSLRTETRLAGPVDHSVPVLAVRDISGDLRTIVFGYACHATTLSSYQWSGDYPGFAQLQLEANHPDCMAMFWAGCGADQNPLPRRTVALCQHYGQQLAVAVDTVLLTTSMKAIPSRLRTVYQEVDLAFATVPDRQQIEADRESKDPYVASRAEMWLEKLDRGETLSSAYPYPIGIWQLGNGLQWVMLGGEVVVDYAIQLKQEFPDRPTWIAGYTHDVMAYIPSRRVLREGGYEGGGAMVYYGLPGPWAADVESKIIDTVCSMAEGME